MIDPRAGGTRGQKGYDLDQMLDAVQRDLQDLLETRQTHHGLPEEFTELHRSIFTYGLPDLTSLNAITPQQREEIGRVLEEVISKFEPRLKEVRAFLIDAGDPKQRSLRFRVEARLRVDPAPPVAFETILELTTGKHTIKTSEAKP
jgi:type VI secretion system protein ImpF